MTDGNIQKVVIVGGGTAGWIAAAAMAQVLGPHISIELVESDAIGTVGVGEATIPPIKILNNILNLDEDDFVAKTNGSFKLGIEFNNWGQVGESYLHGFGRPGIGLNRQPFYQYFLRHLHSGGQSNLWDYSIHHKAAYQHKFGRLNKIGNTNMTGLSYAFHFDAGLYAKLLREHAEGNGVKRTEGLVDAVHLDEQTGFINSIGLKDGSIVEGDFFIDCSGFRALLIGDALGVEYNDWSHWLPVNKAVAVGCERTEPLLPYTKATARSAGWQWRIPLQHRTGNGHVFCGKYMSVDEATSILIDNLDAPMLGEPKVLSFVTGRREKFWHKNCVALGLSGSFMEPLESTSIHMVQSNLNKLFTLFPRQRIVDADVDEYNRQVAYEHEHVRDFLILHYKLTKRDDAPFWRYVRDMDVPKSVTDKIALFQGQGRLFHTDEDLFKQASSLQIMLGQGLIPEDHNVLADDISDEQLKLFLSNVEGVASRAVMPLPSHTSFIEQNCKASR